MFYPFLDLLACSACRGALTLLAASERPKRTALRMHRAQRMGPVGAPVGPTLETSRSTVLGRLLSLAAAEPVHDGRDFEVEVVDGVLVCAGCGRWYPVRSSLPELLPDHLRSRDEERERLSGFLAAWSTPPLQAIRDFLLNGPRPVPRIAADEGAHYKIAEMAITKRTLPEGFWGPPLVEPFHPQRPQFSLDLLARFTTTLQRLECGLNAMLLDICAGYAWTTEWLVRLGYRAIGVDICRDYMLAGLPRMESFVPHLLVADVENLPLADDLFDGVFSFDAFHHVPGRPRAMREFERVMRPGARIALIEPGKEHEHHPGSVAVMKQHGILEKGFDQADLTAYVSGTSLGNIVHHRSDAHPHDIFVVQKGASVLPDTRSPRSLLAKIVPEPASGLTRAGEPATLWISVTNCGDTVWLDSTPDGVGTVSLGARLFTDQRELLLDHYVRVRLPRELRPNETLSVRIELPAIARAGHYLVEFDMVDDLGSIHRVIRKVVDDRINDFDLYDNGLLWFKDFAFQAVDWPLTVDGEQPSAPADTALTNASDRGPAWPLEWRVQPPPQAEAKRTARSKPLPAWKRWPRALARRLARWSGL